MVTTTLACRLWESAFPRRTAEVSDETREVLGDHSLSLEKRMAIFTAASESAKAAADRLAGQGAYRYARAALHGMLRQLGWSMAHDERCDIVSSAVSDAYCEFANNPGGLLEAKAMICKALWRLLRPAKTIEVEQDSEAVLWGIPVPVQSDRADANERFSLMVRLMPETVQRTAELLASGYSRRDSAREQGISFQAVDYHVKLLKLLLGGDIYQLVCEAVVDAHA